MLALKVPFFKSNKHKLWYYCWKINFRVKSTSARGKFMAWTCYLLFVIHRRKFTTETTMIFVFALVLSSFRALIDSLCNMFYLQTFHSQCNSMLQRKYRNCTGPIGRLPAVKKEKAERDNLSSFSSKPLIFTSEVILPTAPVLNMLSIRCFSCL